MLVGETPPIATARASAIRVLIVGPTSRSAGLEAWRALRDRGEDAVLLATRRSASPLPAEASRSTPTASTASGAIERMVLEAGRHSRQIIDGQGTLVDPRSTAMLPLLGGSCANRMILAAGWSTSSR